MAGTLTASFEKSLNGSYSVQSAAAAGLNFAVGTLAFGTYTGGGMTLTLPFNNVDYLHIPNASNVMFQYSTATSLVLIFESSGGTSLLEIASDTDVTSFTGVQFVAFGH
jgi:hypothetical protein